MKIGLIGNGAIARYVTAALDTRPHVLAALLLRPGRAAPGDAPAFATVADLPRDLDLMIDCAGHSALAEHGQRILAAGIDMITVSIGALADRQVETALRQAADEGQARLHLASGAIGALDCLAAARVGGLSAVTYTGRKPPEGWRGSPAEGPLDLGNLPPGAHLHFEGSAREAALAYPKNANVAAAVALAGIGFDDTNVQLIADTTLKQNSHEITAQGSFGTFRFQISGNALPDNPKSSALAAMSVVAKLDQLSQSLSL